MTTQELQKLRQAGFTIDQIAELDAKLTKRVGFRALVRTAEVARTYQTTESEWQEAWKIAAAIGDAQ
jgi:hypothetical protein